MATTTPTKVITEAAILSYPHLAMPQAGMNGGKDKFSATLIFPKGTNLDALKAAALAVAEAKWPGKSAQMFASGALKSPFRKDGEEKGYPEGSIFINCRSVQRPGCVYAYADAANGGKPAIIPADKVAEELYAGAKVRASVAAFAYDNSGNKGVSFALNNIQKLGDGERLDGRIAAANEFTADLSEAPADLSGLI